MPYYKTELSNYYFQQKGSGRTLIFAHGLFVDHTIFSHQFKNLSLSHACISFDLPGHGKSNFNAKGWTLDQIAEDFFTFIKTRRIKKPILIGQSQGGMIFMRLAAKYPDWIGGLVMIGASSKSEYENRLDFWREVIEILDSQDQIKVNNIIERIQKNVVSEHFIKNSPSRARKELKMMQSHNPIGLKLGTEAAVLQRNDVSSEIHKIKCKTLIVCGEEDHATPLEISEMMQAQIHNSELEIVENAAHHIPIESPKVLTDRIIEFLHK